jgi:hypothetical protein
VGGGGGGGGASGAVRIIYMSLGRGQMDASFGENVTLLARKMQLASSFIMSNISGVYPIDENLCLILISRIPSGL